MKIFSSVNKVLSISHTSNNDLLNYLTSKNIDSYELDKKILPVVLPGEFVQKRNIDKVYSKEILDSLRDSPWGTTQREQKKGLEFDKSQYEEIDNYCKKNYEKSYSHRWSRLYR